MLHSFKIIVPFNKVYIVEGEDKEDALEQFHTDDYRDPDFVIESNEKPIVRFFNTPSFAAGY